jgi:hypothetical protein
MQNTIPFTFDFVVRNSKGIPKWWYCFGRSFSEHQCPFRNEEVEVMFRNSALQYVGREGCDRFIKILQDAVAEVDGAQLKFRVDFDYAAPDMVEEWGNMDQKIHFSEKEPLFTYFVDTKTTGNIAWFWLGALMRCFQNSPRTIVSFLRLVDMKWGDKNFLEHWGFLTTWNLAHVVQMEPHEPDFNQTFNENDIYANMKLRIQPLSRYLCNNYILYNIPEDKHTYSINTKGNYIYLSDCSSHAKLWYWHEGVIYYGVYWDDTLPKSTLLSAFVDPPKENI